MRFGINDMIEFFSSDPDVTLITDDGDGPKDKTLEALRDKVKNAQEFKGLAWKRYQQAQKDLRYAMRELEVYESHNEYDEK